jgi:PPK2 family polyphosphate:nucleotide phosphotransferase
MRPGKAPAEEHPMALDYAWKLDDGKKVSLEDYDPEFHKGLHRDDAEPLFEGLNAKLASLQELLYAAGTHAVLIVLQGMDTAGKDGTISHVMQNVNPQGCRVTSFKSPTEEDRAHDFLWRIHPHAPGKGLIAIFNRSHYEDVLIVRVHDLVPEKVWKARYDHINAFEQLLVESNTIVLKFFLHVSKGEQAQRFKDREEEKDKRWKLNAGDYEERRFWDDYQRAYEAVLERCSTKDAPWHVVAGNHKWFRNLAVAEAIVAALEPHEDEWRKTLLERGERSYKELQAARKDTSRPSGD